LRCVVTRQDDLRMFDELPGLGSATMLDPRQVFCSLHLRLGLRNFASDVGFRFYMLGMGW
jgi:hypothetical protein